LWSILSNTYKFFYTLKPNCYYHSSNAWGGTGSHRIITRESIKYDLIGRPKKLVHYYRSGNERKLDYIIDYVYEDDKLICEIRTGESFDSNGGDPYGQPITGNLYQKKSYYYEDNQLIEIFTENLSGPTEKFVVVKEDTYMSELEYDYELGSWQLYEGYIQELDQQGNIISYKEYSRGSLQKRYEAKYQNGKQIERIEYSMSDGSCVPQYKHVFQW